VAFQLPEEPGAARRALIVRWVSVAIIVLLVVLLAYLAWMGYAGSGELVRDPNPSADCRTPESAFGWRYEAINYPRSSDGDLATITDRMACPTQGAAAGDRLTASDGTRLAGWYIPAGSGAGPTAATVVLAHDYGANKSDMLEWAQLLHDDYNLVLFDLRNHGQSESADTTLGVTEQRDVAAVVDWLVASKGVTRIGLLGVSLGGAAAVNEAVGDQRVDALILDATHATAANAVQARLERAGYPLSLPTAWSILFGGLLRTGVDMSSADPVQAIERYGDGGRPVLVIGGGRDRMVGTNDTQDLLMAAREGGAQVEAEVCPDAAHAGSLATCPGDYAGWVLGFLSRSFGNAS
jgi:pimeloyl-ACP methyl ester carboxylesterase